MVECVLLDKQNDFLYIFPAIYLFLNYENPT